MPIKSKVRSFIVRLSIVSLLTVFLPCESRAEIIHLDSASLAAEGVFTLLNAQQLEDEVNSDVFNPRGMELELAAPTGGTVAVDDFSVEGPGLTVIGGSGFILRWTTPVKSVRIGFSSFKDGGNRGVYAFDTAVDYIRDPLNTSQSINGNVIANPDTSLAVDSALGVVVSPGDLSLTVNASSISSVWVYTEQFLTSWTEIEFETVSQSTVPEPSSLGLFVIGLSALGFGVSRRRGVGRTGSGGNRRHTMGLPL